MVIFFCSIMRLEPLKNSLESSPTALRVYRSISLDFNFNRSEWAILSQRIATIYDNLYGPELKKVQQKDPFSDYYHKVREYPVEFIPIMINVIKEALK